MKIAALLIALTGSVQEAVVENLAAAFARDPQSAEAGERLWRLARTAPPEPVLVDAVAGAADRLGPDGPVAAGVLLRRALRPLDALEAFDRASGHPAALIEAGWLLAELRLDDLALARFARAPSNPAVHYGRASLFARAGRTEEAFGEVETLLAEDPGNVAGALLRAELLDSSGREDEALARLRDLVARQGGASPAGMRLAHILLRGGEPEEAAGLLETVLEEAPTNGEAWLLLARSREETGRLREATDAYRSAIEHDQNEARMGLGRLLARSGDREEAERLLAGFEQRKRIADESARLLADAEFRPDDFAAASAFTLHALETGNNGLALRASQRFLVERPDDFERHLLLARIWRAAGSQRDAVRVLRRGLSRFADDPEAVERFREALAE